MLVSLLPSIRCTRHGGTFDFEFHEEALGHGSRRILIEGSVVSGWKARDDVRTIEIHNIHTYTHTHVRIQRMVMDRLRTFANKLVGTR